MRILVCNDDGIASPALKILVKYALTLGQVDLFAPKDQQSAASMAINIRSPFEVLPVDYLPGVRAFQVASTAADCVRYAVCGLKEHYDLCLAGINSGLNTGHDIAYSSTCACIFEAAYWKIPALAVSCETDCFDTAEKYLQPAMEFIFQHKLLEAWPLLNVNLPFAQDLKGIRITRMKQAPYFIDRYEDRGGSLTQAVGYSVYKGETDLDVDLDAVMNGYISISPLTVDRTADRAYEDMKKLNG